MQTQAELVNSCPLCLQTYPSRQMLEVEISHHAVPGARSIELCSRCVAAIWTASQRALEELKTDQLISGGEGDGSGAGEIATDTSSEFPPPAESAAAPAPESEATIEPLRVSEPRRRGRPRKST